MSLFTTNEINPMRNSIYLSLAILFISIACQEGSPVSQPEIKDESGLIKVTIMYPNEENGTFDMDYYKNSHMPMLAELFGDAMIQYKIDNGLAARDPEEPVPFLAIGYLYFEKLRDYQNAFGPNAEQILGDIPNYTNIRPIVQISEVIK